MAKSFLLGQVSCDFLSKEEFLSSVSQWIQGNEFHHVVTLNPEMVIQTEHDLLFRVATTRATLRIPDGAGLWWAKNYLQSSQGLIASLYSFLWHPTLRLTGVDMVREIAAVAEKEGKSIYIVGGWDKEKVKAIEVLQKKFPDLVLHTFTSHSYSFDGPPALLADIHAKQPTILLVAYGSPKQTLWIDRHQASLPSVRLAMGIGGALAMIGDTLPRAPIWVRSLNLEWAWRLFLEPWRLQRIMRATISFPLLIHRQKQRQQC